MRPTSVLAAVPPTRTTPAERAAYVRAFALSGLSAAAFCRTHHLTVGTFARWRQEGAKEAAPRFARVVVAEAPSVGSTDTRLVIHGPAGIAEITGVDAATLVRLARRVLRAR